MQTKKSTTIITILLLIFLFPIGLIVMYAATNWKTGLKIIITILGPIFLILGSILFTSFFVALNPQAQIQKAKCTKVCTEQYSKTSTEYQNCLLTCANPTSNKYPEKDRNVFISNCVSDGATVESCTCMINYAETKFTWEELLQNDNKESLEFNSKFEKEMKQGASLCKYSGTL